MNTWPQNPFYQPARDAYDTLSQATDAKDKEYQLLRDSALRLIRALKIEGGCNVQFALDPLSFNYYLIEIGRASCRERV